MTLKLSAEQREFQDSLHSFFAEKFSSEYLRKRCEQNNSSDTVRWQELCELGLCDFFSSTDRESGGGAYELGLVAYECGFALVSEALVEHLLAGPYCFTHLLQKETKQRLQELLSESTMQAITVGKLHATVVSSVNIAQLQIAEQAKSSLEVTGKVPYVLAGDCAGFTLLHGIRSNESELFALATADQSKQLEAALDRTQKIANVDLKKCKGIKLSPPEAKKIKHLLQAVKAMEMAGVCARATAMTVEYVKTRKQFGVPVGGFQAVQHRAADLHLQSEAMLALAKFAVWSADHSPDQFPLAAESAIAFACEQGAAIVEGAIQLHGGIGFTWEYDLHLYLRRAKSIEVRYKPSESESLALLATAARQ